MQERKTDVIALKKLMIENGFDSVIRLSVASEINRNTLGSVLGGSIQPSAEVMDKLINVLKIPASLAGEIFFNPDLRNTKVKGDQDSANVEQSAVPVPAAAAAASEPEPAEEIAGGDDLLIKATERVG